MQVFYKKFRVLLLAVVILSQMGCSQLMSKFVAATAKAIPTSTQTTASLSGIEITVGMGSNLHSADLGALEQDLFSGWKTGGDWVVIKFSNKNGSGFYKIDGTVTVDGKPAEYFNVGLYSIVLEASPSPRKVEIATTTGEKGSFTLAPSKKKIKVISLNGQKDNISLDLTKDVVVELEETGVPENTPLQVGLAINQVGIKSIVRAAFIRSGSKLTIPAAVFRNMDFVPAGGLFYSYDKSFLSFDINSMENATDVTGAFSSVQYTSNYSDGKFVTVAKNPVLNVGLTAKGEDKLKDGEMRYELFKPNAFRSRPSEHIKKIGIISFGISGITAFNYEFKLYGSDKKLKTTTTTKVTFPQQSNEVWGAVVDKMYPEIMSIVQSEFNAAEALPLEAITQTAGYKSVEMFSKADFNTPDGFSKSYRNGKILAQVPRNQRGYEEKIMKESGADAIMTLKLELVAAAEKTKVEDAKKSDFGVIVPKLTFEIVGKPKFDGDEMKYVSGTITGKGIKAEEIGLVVTTHDEATTFFKDKWDVNTIRKVGTLTPERLDNLIRKSDLLKEFAKALKEIRTKEKENNDYVTVWNLQK